MISNLSQVTDNLYRGGAPTPPDVIDLKNALGINKIVSLDMESGRKINRTCQILGIKHIILPIEPYNVKEALKTISALNLKKLLLSDGPTFIHCRYGKDRTGLLIALLRVKYLGYTPTKALEEAKSFGFGFGVPERTISLFEKLINSSKVEQLDINEADIVSNEREYIGDNRDSFLDEGHQGSFAPYLSITRQDPVDSVYNFIMEQSPTRENYFDDHPIKQHNSKDENVIPQVGVYDNDAGMNGVGPTQNAGGFIYE